MEIQVIAVGFTRKCDDRAPQLFADTLSTIIRFHVQSDQIQCFTLPTRINVEAQSVAHRLPVTALSENSQTQSNATVTRAYKLTPNPMFLQQSKNTAAPCRRKTHRSHHHELNLAEVKGYLFERNLGDSSLHIPSGSSLAAPGLFEKFAISFDHFRGSEECEWSTFVFELI